MIKKYPWNEPDETKRWWTYADCSHEQSTWILVGRGSDGAWGDIDDLNPELYDARQMRWTSLGRGDDPSWSNIDHLDPELYDEHIFQMVSLTGKVGIQEYKSKVSYEQYRKTLKTIKENNPEWLI